MKIVSLKSGPEKLAVVLEIIQLATVAEVEIAEDDISVLGNEVGNGCVFKKRTQRFVAELFSVHYL